jgi:shikimate kinase
MGVGKTTVGRRIAGALGWEAVDGDVELERIAGCTAAELARRDDLAALHALEAEVLLQSLARDDSCVVMPAASTIDDARCRHALASVFVVLLEASIDVLTDRAGRGTHRPLDDDVAAQLREQTRQRASRFAEVADLTFDSGRLDPETIAARVVEVVRAR